MKHIILFISLSFAIVAQHNNIIINATKYDQILFSLSNTYFNKIEKITEFEYFSGALMFQGLFVLSDNELFSFRTALSFASYKANYITSDEVTNKAFLLNPYISYFNLDSISLIKYEFGLFIPIFSLNVDETAFIPYSFNSADYLFYIDHYRYTLTSQIMYRLYSDNMINLDASHSLYFSTVKKNNLWYFKPYMGLKYQISPHVIGRYDYGVTWFTTVEMKDVFDSAYKSAVSHVEFYFGIHTNRFKPVISYELKAYDFNIKHKAQTIKLNFSYQFSPIIEIINFD
jgi:hypothetical protein